MCHKIPKIIHLTGAPYVVKAPALFSLLAVVRHSSIAVFSQICKGMYINGLNGGGIFLLPFAYIMLSGR